MYSSGIRNYNGGQWSAVSCFSAPSSHGRKTSTRRVILLLQGPAPSIMAYKDKVLAGMITFMEQIFTVLPSNICPTKVVWFLFMMFMTLCVLRIIIPEMKAMYHVIVADINDFLETLRWMLHKEDAVHMRLIRSQGQQIGDMTCRIESLMRVDEEQRSLYQQSICSQGQQIDDMTCRIESLMRVVEEQRSLYQQSENMLITYEGIVEVNTEIIKDYSEILQRIFCGNLNDQSQFMSDADINVNSGGNEEENGNCVTEDNQENTLCLNEEITGGEEEICSNDREILQKTGSNELSDQSTSNTEVYNPLIREGNEEATPQRLKEDDGTTEVENTLCLNEEIIGGEEEICSNDREILQKTGSNELSDQSTSITEVYNPLIREGNEEATPQWLKEDDGTTEVNKLLDLMEEMIERQDEIGSNDRERKKFVPKPTIMEERNEVYSFSSESSVPSVMQKEQKGDTREEDASSCESAMPVTMQKEDKIEESVSSFVSPTSAVVQEKNKKRKNLFAWFPHKSKHAGAKQKE